ncbi:hypothetical protein CPB97_012006, partial [Podila verticillata]
MKKASNWAAKWFTSPSPPFSPSDDPQTPRSVHSTFSKTSQPYRLLNSSKPKPLFTYQVTNDSTLSIDTNNTSVHNHPYGAFAGVTAATASTSCTSLDTTPSLDDNNSHMFEYGHNNDVRKERSFLKSWKRHYPQGRLAQASASAPDIRLGDERSLTLSSFPEPPGPFSPTLRRHPPGGSGSSVSSGRSNLRNMFLSRDPAPDTVPSRAVFSSSSSSVCSVSSTSLTVIRYPPEPTTSTRRPFADKPEGTKEQGWSERLSLQSKRLRSSILSNGSTKKAIPPSLLGSRIHKHNHSTSSLPPTMPDTPTSVAAAISHLSPSPKPKVATETRITAAVALQTKNTSHPPESAAKMGEKITKASPPPLQASVSPPPQILGHDNLSLTYGLMLQSLPEDEEQLNAQVSNLFGIAMHFAHKIQRLEKELQELQTQTSIDQAETDKTELPSCSESECHDDTSLTETTLDQGISHEVHEDLKAEIRRDLQASRSIFTALLSPTVMSLIQSSFPQFGRPCKSGREESKVVTSPVTLGYVPSMTSTVREGQEDAGASSGGGGRSMLKCGAVSDQIVYPSALRSNPITLSRGLKVVQSDSPTPKTTSTPIAPVDEVSVAEEIVQEQKPLEGSDITNAVVSGDTFGKEEYLETQDDQQGADDKDASSNSSLPPPRPQRPEVSIDLDFLMSVFQSQLIAREQSWLERSAELEQIAEKDPSKRDGTSTSTSENKEINPPKTCLHTPPPTSQCPEEMPTPRNSSSAPAPLTPRTSSLPKDRTLVRKTPPPPSSSPASCSESLVTSPEMDLQNRQLRLEQDVQHLMDVLTGHAHVQAQRSHLHLCHAGRCNHAHHHPRYYSMDGSEH